MEVGRIRPFESVRSNPAGILGAVVRGVAGAVALSFLYVVICHYCPIIYLNILFAVGYGFLVGALCRAGIKAGRVNSVKGAVIAGLSVGAIMAWMAWVAYLWMYLDYNFREYLYFLVNPSEVLSGISVVGHHPLWSLSRSGAPPAVFYYVVWILEALLLAGCAVRVPVRFVRENKLCPDCGKWMTSTGEQAFFGAGDWDAVGQELAEGRIGALLALPRTEPAGIPEAKWLDAGAFACPECDDGGCYVTVASVAVLPAKKKGEVQRKVRVMARFVEVGNDDADALFHPVSAEPEADGAGAMPEEETAHAAAEQE